MVKKCAICYHPILTTQKAVMHTSVKLCPEKFIGRWLHSACAYSKNIPIPKEDEEELLNAKNKKQK